MGLGREKREDTHKNMNAHICTYMCIYMQARTPHRNHVFTITSTSVTCMLIWPNQGKGSKMGEMGIGLFTKSSSVVI